MNAWWGELAAYLILLALGAGYLFAADRLRQRRIAKVRARENAATLAWFATQAELDTAKARGRDVIDQHLAETPLYVETCEAEAARIAAAELDDDLARMFGEAR